MTALGLYIHIPFCVQKCRYCDFLSYGETDPSLHFRYMEALVREAELVGLQLDGLPVDTIFIGGGTPSILEESLMDRLFERIRRSFSILPNAEITLEANPSTLLEPKLRTYHQLGINRLSLGVQSLDDKILSTLGRVHSAEDALDSYWMARKAGFENINLDLMFSVPGLTMEKWSLSLSNILALEPEHLSLYSLEIEEGTPFYTMAKEGRIPYPDDEIDRAMYWEAINRIQGMGYEPYEISNVSKPGYACRHNLKYWSMDPYIGLGLGAHSYFDGWRYQNQNDLVTYLSCGNHGRGKTTENPFVMHQHRNDPNDDRGEFLFTGLRKTEGISLASFEERFHIPLLDLHGDAIRRHLDQDLLLLDSRTGYLRFSPKGIDLSNYVLRDFV